MTTKVDDIDQRAILGARIHQIRHQRRLSLREVGQQADVSASFLSQVERGQSGASVATLMKIASALGVSIPDLFSSGTTPAATVVRRADRPVIDAGTGFRKTLVSQRPIRHIEACVGEFEPGGTTGELYQHGDSQEIVLVLEGDVAVFLADQTYSLSRGDSLEYQTSTPHGIANTGPDTAEVLYIVSPSTSSGSHQNGAGAPHAHARSPRVKRV
ncbi:cupin domain-containing protein [Aeromicrobium sp. JJY06]|uniref:cupin domain-containing protein n=1 Tax=Aeromicrobium sp. JJY06 TaxID=3373478 RepID=UPI00376F3A66